MEVALLIIIIIIFLIFLNRILLKMDRLQEGLYDLSRKLDHYRKLSETAEKQVTVPKPEIKPAPAPEFEKPVMEKRPDIPAPVPAARVASMQAPVTQNPAPPAVTLPKEQKSWWERFKEQNPDLERFIGENLINKIGILILVLGISYFVKFAIDKNWIGEPARVGVGILAGSIVMLVAHRLRKNYKAFSSVLAAGAISIFYFTIAVAFHDYHLFSQTVAFVIMVVITALSAFISVSYNRQELAALTLIGGFAVPFMVSTGSGNYVVLFTYITILNIGILLIALYKKWGFINLQAYLFTVLLYGGWLYTIAGTENAPYDGALIFALVFYLMFILMNIINNIRTNTAFTNMQLSILVSNTFLFYTAGMVSMDYFMPQYKGMFTLLLGAFNFCFAWLLYKKLNIDQKVIYILIGLTLTFVTLAIPIQFEGNYITLFWAAEAVLLMWLAQKSKIESFRFGSGIVHSLMLISLVMDWMQIYFGIAEPSPVINPGFLTGVFSIASAIAVLLLLKRDSGVYKLYGFTFNVKNYTGVVKILTTMLVYLTGFLELNFQAEFYLESRYAAYSLTAFYHLLFSAVLLHIYIVNSDEYARRFGTRLGLLNILIFILLLPLLAHNELKHYLSGEIQSNAAYWLHFALLAAAAYTAWLVYKMNRTKVFEKFRQGGVMPWITVFFLVYWASNELVLHVLTISLSPVTIEDINAVYTLEQYRMYDRSSMFNILAEVNIEQVTMQVVKTGYPVLWGSLACLMLLLGIKKQLKILRIAALVLLGITIAKLFLYDIRNASETGKIIAFILLGVLILVISFVYQKIKLLVIEDKPETNDMANENL